MKRLRTLFGGTQATKPPVADYPASLGNNDSNNSHASSIEHPHPKDDVNAGPQTNASGGVGPYDMSLPDPIFVASDEIARRVLDETGELQRAIDDGAKPTFPITREILARVRGVVEFSLRGGGSTTLHSTLIKPGAEWGMSQFGPVFLREPDSSRGRDAKASYDLVMKMFREYAFLEETGGRPRPGEEATALPENLISGLEALGWQRVHDDAPLLERWIDVEPGFVQKVMFGGEFGQGVFYAYLCPWERSTMPAWAAEAGGVVLGEILVLSRRVDGIRNMTANQVDTTAKQMASDAVPLLQSHVHIGEHQRRFIDAGYDPDSPEGQAFSVIAQSRLVFGVWGAGQSAEACFAELARLNPDVLKANVVPMGYGFSDDVRTGWAVVSGSVGSAAFGFEIEDGGSKNLIQFGGPDVRPPFQVVMMNSGRTHGAFHAILEGSRLVPMETLPGMALRVRADLAKGLLGLGWEVTGDDLYYIRHGEAVVFLMAWNENHFGLFSGARETTRVEDPYQLQEVFDEPSLVLLLGRNDPLLEPYKLTAAAQNLIAHL